MTDSRYVLLAMPDVNGYLRGKALRGSAFEGAAENGTVMTDLLLGLDPVDTPISDYEGFGIRSGAGDLIVHADLETLHELTWRPGWSVCLATPSWRDGSPCELAVREVLRQALDGIRDLGYETRAAFEYEVRIWDGEGQPLSTGISYSIVEAGRYHTLVAALEPALDALGIELSAIHTEAGPGLLELNLAAQEGLRAADDAALVKLAVKGVAETLGLRASFLAKTAPGEEGSSGHVHLSLWNGDANAFAPEDGADLTAPAAQSVAGMVEHLAGASLLLNPTVNSYKRLVPGWFAPVNASWGMENRSAALRVISSSAQPDRCRIECRRPGADANPYLALAGLLVAAGDGLRAGAEPPPPVVGDAYARADLPALPGSLESALAAFRDDGALRAGLGDGFSDYFALSREWELKAWREAVSDWERERYERAV